MFPNVSIYISRIVVLLIAVPLVLICSFVTFLHLFFFFDWGAMFVQLFPLIFFNWCPTTNNYYSELINTCIFLLFLFCFFNLVEILLLCLCIFPFSVVFYVHIECAATLRWSAHMYNQINAKVLYIKSNSNQPEEHVRWWRCCFSWWTLDLLAYLVGSRAPCHAIEVKGHRRCCLQWVSVKPMGHYVERGTPAEGRLQHSDNRLMTPTRLLCV